MSLIGYVTDISLPLSRYWPRAAAVGERLWSKATVNDTTAAIPRLHNFRCRLIRYDSIPHPLLTISNFAAMVYCVCVCVFCVVVEFQQSQLKVQVTAPLNGMVKLKDNSIERNRKTLLYYMDKK